MGGLGLMLSRTAQEGDSKVDVEVTAGSIEGRKKCVAIVCPFVGRCIIICDIIVFCYPHVLPPLLSGSLPLVRSDLPMETTTYTHTLLEWSEDWSTEQ